MVFDSITLVCEFRKVGGPRISGTERRPYQSRDYVEEHIGRHGLRGYGYNARQSP